MMRMFVCVLLLLPSCACAIDLVVPNDLQANAIARIEIRGLNPDDQSRVTITVEPHATVIPASWGKDQFLLFQSARAGEFTIRLRMNAWATKLAEAVSEAETQVDPDLMAELSAMRSKIVATFPAVDITAVVMVGSQPTPPPKPDPIPIPPTPGKRCLVIVRETAATTPDIARLIIDLQSARSGASARIRANGHKVFVFDKDVAIDWFAHVRDIGLPAMVVTDESMRTIISKQRLPETSEAVERLTK